MAKKKVQNEESKNDGILFREIEGLIFILVAVLGYGEFGMVGRMIRNFGVFLCGSFYFLFLAAALILGCVFMFARKSPKYMSSRLIGLYYH